MIPTVRFSGVRPGRFEDRLTDNQSHDHHLHRFRVKDQCVAIAASLRVNRSCSQFQYRFQELAEAKPPQVCWIKVTMMS